MNRGERQHQERTAFARKQARTPGYRPKYHGKTPGRGCSCEMCGNPRNHYGDRTRQEELATVDSIDRLVDDVLHPKEIELIGCECAWCMRDSSVEIPEVGSVTTSLAEKLKRAA